MDRLEFCNIVSDYRKSSGIKMKDICFQMNVMPTAVYRLEKGENNFSMSNMFAYLKALGVYIHLYSDIHPIKYKLTSLEHFYSAFMDMRILQKLSQRKIELMLGLSHGIVSSIESKKKNITIDTFLQCVYGLGYQIKIEKL